MDGQNIKQEQLLQADKKIRRMQTYQEIWKGTHNKVKKTYGKFSSFKKCKYVTRLIYQQWQTS